MANLIRGTALTLRSLGPYVLFKETFRRIFGVKYHYNNVLVDSSTTFRILRSIVLRGYNIRAFGSEIVVQTPFGELCVNAVDRDLLFLVLTEPLEEMYGFVDVKDAVVIDVGAYFGETALLFLSKGAFRIYAFEPVDRHYQYLLKNILRNGAINRIIPLSYGAWFRETILNVKYGGSGTGLHTVENPQVHIKVRHLGSILREIYEREGRIDLVKMDGEGCEYSLLNLPNDSIKLAKQYIIEIHGAEVPILDKMTECGYIHRLIKRISDLLAVYHFMR